MAMTIWKYTLVGGYNTFDMPKGAKILSVAAQDDDVCIWALVDPSAPKVSRQILALGTGHDAPDGIEKTAYIGTAMLAGGTLVIHVFDVWEA
jgi:hypothetical protein